MHFWIDKRSQGYGFNGRPGVHATIASARRRNKSLVTPVHRLQTIESSTVSQQLRRSYQQHMSPRLENNINVQCQSPVSSNDPSNGTAISRPSPPPMMDNSIYIDPPIEGPMLGNAAHAQFMRLNGLTKYGMWASFGLTTISVVATKFYVDQQGTFEILLLCLLGVVSAGLMVFCVLIICKRSTAQQFISVQAATPQPTGVELEITDVVPQHEVIISPMSNSISQQTTTETRTVMPDLEQPPPPYHIAILLPTKENVCADFPPPSYENAVR